jgi:membrane protein required for colicin V production
MQTVDLIILLPILYGAFKGYKRGFIIEIVSIAAFIISVLVAFKFMAEATGFVSKYIDNPITKRMMPYIGFAVLFFPIIFFINKLGWLLRSSTKTSLLGSFDSLIGAGVGMLTWAFGISIVFWLINAVDIKIADNQTDKSILLPIIGPIAPKIIDKTTNFVQKTDFKKPFEDFTKPKSEDK